MKSKMLLNNRIWMIVVFSICSLYLSAQPFTVNLWPGGAPGAIVCPDYIETNNNGWVEKVSDPEMAVYLPSPEKATGTAVLICPGGGYVGVATGFSFFIDIARNFQENGIAVFILKYRLPSDKIMKDKSVGPLQDAQRAMRIIRTRAAEWHIDPQKVGALGSSAGGHLVSTLATHYDAKVYESDAISARPDFTILVCPAISFAANVPLKNADGSATPYKVAIESLIGKNPDAATVKYFSSEQQVTGNTPPAFLVHAADDDISPVEQSMMYFSALKDHKIPAEMHIVQKGGHEHLLDKGTTGEIWFPTVMKWLKMNGWLSENN